MGAQAVVQGWGPFAVAVAAHIQGVAAVFLPQRQADDVPGMGVQPAAVQEHHRQPPQGSPEATWGTPVEIVQPHPAQHDVLMLGQDNARNTDTGGRGDRGEVPGFLGGRWRRARCLLKRVHDLVPARRSRPPLRANMRLLSLDRVTERVYRLLFMCSIDLEQDDLTTKARLRETALALCAGHGIPATTRRSIAAAAGVSPGLVIHHFGSKDGLRRAVDAVVVKRITAALSEVPAGSSGASLIDQRAEVLARVLQPQPALLQYIAQALSESGAAAGAAFAPRCATARAPPAP